MFKDKSDDSKEIIKKEFNQISKRKIKTNCDDIFEAVNVPEDEKEQYQAEFNEYFSKLDSTDLAVVDESISKCIFLTQYNIKITSHNLEDTLALAFHLGRENVLYPKVLNFASYILLYDKKLADEIVDSEIISQFIELLSCPMNESEAKLMNNFFSTTYDVVKAMNDKFHFLKAIGDRLNNPSLSETDFQNLINIIITIIEEYDKVQVGDISVYFLDKVVKKFIFCDNQTKFGETCHLYMLMLLDTLKNEVLEFMTKPIEGDQSYLEDYLIQMFGEVDKQIYREYILNIFINFSGGSDWYTKILYERGILDKFLSILPSLTNNNCKVKIIQTMQNFFSLGIEKVLEIVSSSLTEVALEIINEATLKNKIAALKYFCGICQYSNDPNILDFLVKNKIINKIFEFFEVEDCSVWTLIMTALQCNAENAFNAGVETKDLFDHPLFNEIELNSFYQDLSKIQSVIDGFKSRSKKKEYKNLYQIADDFLQIVDPIIYGE